MMGCINRHWRTLLGGMLGGALAAGPATGGELSLWSRGDHAYLAAGQAMPIWPMLPGELDQADGSVTLIVELPDGFELAAVGRSDAFAMQPQPLLVPESVEHERGDDTVAYRFELGQIETSRQGRLSLMIDPGPHPPGDYDAKLRLYRERADSPIAQRDVQIHVLEALDGRRPERLNLGVYNYNGLMENDFAAAVDEAVLSSGINTIWDMRRAEMGGGPDKVAPTAERLREHGVRGGVLWFWHRWAKSIAEEHPESRWISADGEPYDPDNASFDDRHAAFSPTWILDHRDTVMPLLIESLRAYVEHPLYDTIVNDFEYRAMDRERTRAYGDIHNPGTMERFQAFAGLDEPVPADPEHIAEHHGEDWVEFRCHQAAEMSAMVAEAVREIDPMFSYGLYSGYQYVGEHEGFTRQRYSVDWALMAERGEIDFASVGYYGRADDLAATAEAVNGRPVTAAEMYVSSFNDHDRTMPDPDTFAMRLLSSTLAAGGAGGANTWYLQVMDAAAFSAVARVSRVLAEIEDFLIDGQAVHDQIEAPRELGSGSVFGYRLGERRVAVVINRSEHRTIDARLRWRDRIVKPDTVEIVSGERLGDQEVLRRRLAPRQFAVFVTISDGN